MKTLIISIIMFFAITTQAQEKAYSVSKDNKNGELVFNGPITFDDLNSEPSFSWLRKGEEEYRPNKEILTRLKSRLKDYQLVVFLGTWCEDSQYLIPKLLKVLHMVDYPVSTIAMYGVDREKTTKSGEQKKYAVTLVPTIILFKDGKEAGRITESVQKSVEADMAAIVEGK